MDEAKCSFSEADLLESEGTMTRVFFSYSHKDEALRNELEKHLTALKHQGIVEMWHDRRIGAGQEFDQEISENLEKADIILLLVSSDFISSPYCYGIEMTRALERHKNGEARVIPVILRPCYWQNLPFGRLLATPTDGQPVTKFANQDEAFLEITKAIHDASKQLGTVSVTTTRTRPVNRPDRSNTAAAPLAASSIRSSNLRVKKQFSDHERDQFLDEAFEYVANYFENSLAELKNRNPEVDSRFRRIDSNHFSAAVYINGVRKSGCQIWIGGRYFTNTIGFSFDENGDYSSYNEMLRLEDDGYSLFLKATGLQFQYRAGNEQLTNEGGAEYFWRMFIEPLQR